jgi:hypothetical protein
MKDALDKKKIGLAVGSFTAGIHFFWSILVLIGLAQPLMDWIFQLHMIRPPYTIMPFSLINMIVLILISFIGGYGAGWFFAYVWNYLLKKK